MPLSFSLTEKWLFCQFVLRFITALWNPGGFFVAHLWHQPIRRALAGAIERLCKSREHQNQGGPARLAVRG
jgi:hypothetical protein